LLVLADKEEAASLGLKREIPKTPAFIDLRKGQNNSSDCSPAKHGRSCSATSSWVHYEWQQPPVHWNREHVQ
jgi:hypothetical protein